MESFNLRSYIEPLLKWWWLLLLAALISGVASFVYLVRQTETYESRTSLMVGNFIQDPNPNGQEFYLTQQLAETYAEFVNRGAVSEATRTALEMDWLPYFSARPSGQLLEISVVAEDPQLAQLVAQELANQVILQGPAGQSEGDRQAFVDQRLQKLEKDIFATEDEIERLETELANELGASKIRSLEGEITVLEEKVETLQIAYAGFLSTTQRGAANSIYVFEPASYPLGPIPKGYALYLAVAIVFGLALASAGAYLIEYLDDTVKSTTQIHDQLGLSTLGAIPDLGKNGAADDQNLIMLGNSLDPAAEAYRVLRTNLQFASVDRTLQLLQVTSPSPGEGKSVTTANLSAALASSGKRVILVDADFRRPMQHKLFGLINNYGMTTALLGHTDSFEELLRETSIPTLRVLPTGPLPPNPAELLGSKAMHDALMSLREQCDIVVIDSPPATLVSDTAVIAGQVDGVLLVLRSGHTRKGYARHALDALRQVDAPILGVVLNAVAQNDSGYYYSHVSRYGYGYSHAFSKVGSEPAAQPKQQAKNGSGKPSTNALLGRRKHAAKPGAKTPTAQGTQVPAEPDPAG